MSTSAETSSSSNTRLGPVEMLVLAFMIAAVAVGAVMSAKLLQKRVLASSAATATLQVQIHSIDPPLTRPV